MSNTRVKKLQTEGRSLQETTDTGAVTTHPIQAAPAITDTQLATFGQTKVEITNKTSPVLIPSMFNSGLRYYKVATLSKTFPTGYFTRLAEVEVWDRSRYISCMQIRVTISGGVFTSSVEFITHFNTNPNWIVGYIDTGTDIEYYVGMANDIGHRKTASALSYWTFPATVNETVLNDASTLTLLTPSYAGVTTESGVWTPNVIGATTAGALTYAFRTGNYYRIGKQITLILVTSGTYVTKPTGTVQISGLPFTSTAIAGGTPMPVTIPYCSDVNPKYCSLSSLGGTILTMSTVPVNAASVVLDWSAINSVNFAIFGTITYLIP